MNFIYMLRLGKVGQGNNSKHWMYDRKCVSIIDHSGDYRSNPNHPFSNEKVAEASGATSKQK